MVSVNSLFMGRKRVQIATNCVGDFKKQLAYMIEKEQLTLNQVYNCDETGLCSS